ncbi:MAG: carbamoyl-phosphate synthase large subunit [Dehalococcoidia bacterium]
MTYGPKKVLVIGSGPIIIGQAAEFDYAGTQACKSLRDEGVTTILVNSNPATIMTDEGIADVVYIEPLTVDSLTKIIQKELPDGLLPTLGGQTGLNLAVELADAGVLEKYNVRLLGTPLDSIKSAEDRNLFRELLIDIGEPVPASAIVNSLDEAKEKAEELGFPLVIRPAYTLGGTGGGIAYSYDEMVSVVTSGLAASPISQVLLDSSLIGWKELEYEVMRDSADNCITICNMENIDPMGVHTGDSIVVAPSQTLSDKEYQMLRSASLKIIRELGIEGGCNVQFALRPNKSIAKYLPNQERLESDYYVIEVNPRVSRSSALASKATGYPIARVAAKIAVGKTLDEIPNMVTQKTLAAFEPSLDYCVVKIPRWPFDKFPGGERTLGTEMKATGEVMTIARSFEAAFQKAVRSLEIENRSIHWENPEWFSSDEGNNLKIPFHPTDERLWVLMSALRKGMDFEKICEHTFVDPWFIHSFKNITDFEGHIKNKGIYEELLIEAKKLGISDSRIGMLTGKSSKEVREIRLGFGIKPVYKMVDTCASEFEAETPYYYSTYEQENEALPLFEKKAIVIGSGPIRIGQGIEFDYCSVHAAWALQEAGIKSIMVNSNPETVSTDFDTSDRLYFEPLDDESIQDIIDNETFIGNDGEKNVPPSIVQFGGQTAINLSQSLNDLDLPILGSSAEAIDIASDRHLFEEFLKSLNIPNPPGLAIDTVDEAVSVAQDIGYPVLLRPSYVLGGRAMEIVQNPKELKKYMKNAIGLGGGRKILIDKYLEGREVEVDAVCDGTDVLVPGVMEHVERAGVHSGDSMAIYPGLSLTKSEVDTIVEYTTKIGLELGVKGLMNIQYVIVGGEAYRNPSDKSRDSDRMGGDVYVIEVNPRSSRTIPFISKVTSVPMVNLAAKVMLGYKLQGMGYRGGLWEKQDLVGVKAPVFSMSKLYGVDTYLGPEMKSTGEVMGIDFDFESAFTKALVAASLTIPDKGSILLSISDRHKKDSVAAIKALYNHNYKIFATQGTADFIRSMDIPVEVVAKASEQVFPNTVQLIEQGQVNAVINTIEGDRDALQDGFEIRRAATEKRIPCFTSLDTARAAIDNLSASHSTYNINPINKYVKNTRPKI